MQEILGSFVQICCKISGSIPISVEWQKDGKKIFSGVKHKLIQQDNSVSVELEQLEPADAGRYSCKLTNAAGSCESSATLLVKGWTVFFSYWNCSRKPTLRVRMSLTCCVLFRTSQLRESP